MEEKFSGIGYSAKVKISIEANDKIIYSKLFKNNGSVRLFEFLGNCLQGEAAADSKRPKMVQGFKYPRDTELSGNNVADEIKKAIWNPFYENVSGSTKVVESSTSRIMSTSIKLKTTKGYRTNDNTTANYGVPADNVEVYYAFRLPATQLFNDEINMFCLYSDTTVDPEDFSACFLLTNSAKTAWDPISLKDILGNYTLIIEWTMTIKNTISEESE